MGYKSIVSSRLEVIVGVGVVLAAGIDVIESGVEYIYITTISRDHILCVLEGTVVCINT